MRQATGITANDLFDCNQQQQDQLLPLQQDASNILCFQAGSGYGSTGMPSGGGSDDKFPSPGSDFLKGNKADDKISPEFFKMDNMVTVSPKQLSFGGSNG